MSEHRVIVRSAAQLRRRWALMAVAGTAALGLAWGLYALGKAQAPGERERLEAHVAELQAQRQNLRGDNRRLRTESARLAERIVVLERSAEVDQVAAGELRASIEALQTRIAELKKELAFYRGIVSPEEAEAGLRVQEFRVEPTGETGTYRFHLVLIQAMRHNREVSGHVRLRVKALRDSESITLAWPEVALDSSARLVFSFRYFQELGAAFRLPPAIEPILVEVEIISGDDIVTETYRWRELVATRG